MYATKLVNKNLVDNNAYISIGDPYKDAAQNVFRQPKKGEPVPKPMLMTVSSAVVVWLIRATVHIVIMSLTPRLFCPSYLYL